MFENEPLENIVWSIVGLCLGALGLLAASISVTLSYLRGTNSGRFPLYCAFIALFAAVGLWVISMASDPICSMVLAVATSIAAFMSFVYWLNRIRAR